MTIAIVPLTSAHRRDDFDCGEPALNEFIRRYARQQQSRDFSRTYVVASADGATVEAFITLSVGQVAAIELPPDLKLPRYPVPVFKIGRLAVDLRAQGRDLGRELTRFALSLALDMSGRVGIHAVVVDAKSAAIRAFYQRLGFIPVNEESLSLFLPMETLRRAAT